MPAMRSSALWRMILPLFILFCAIAPVSAHFLLNLNVRILHVEHLADGLRVYLRTPMPYLVAGRVGPVGANGLPEPAPYTTNRMEADKLVHFVDHGQLRRDPIGLGGLAADGFRFDADGKPLEASVEQVRVYPIGKQPEFATLDEAKAAFAGRFVYPDPTNPRPGPGRINWRRPSKMRACPASNAWARRRRRWPDSGADIAFSFWSKAPRKRPYVARRARHPAWPHQ